MCLFIVVDVVWSEQDMMHFQAETLYLAIHLLNRCLRQMKVSTANLQLLGIVCLFLAAKKEECLLPEVLADAVAPAVVDVGLLQMWFGRPRPLYSQEEDFLVQ